MFSNELQGFKELHLWINKHRKQLDIPLIVVMKSTAVYYEEAALFFHKSGKVIAVVLRKSEPVAETDTTAACAPLTFLLLRLLASRVR